MIRMRNEQRIHLVRGQMRISLAIMNDRNVVFVPKNCPHPQERQRQPADVFDRHVSPAADRR